MPFLVFSLVQALVVGVRVWSSLSMCWHIVERVASALTVVKVVAWIAAKVMTLELCMMGCSCRLGMILANLVLGSMWWLARKIVVVTARCS